jgi:hypothetical protein
VGPDETGQYQYHYLLPDGGYVIGYVYEDGRPTKKVYPAGGSGQLGIPAPYGHRNVYGHFHDDKGLMLREDHRSEMICSIDVIYEPHLWYFATEHRYSGKLVCYNVGIDHTLTIGRFEKEVDK